MRAAFGNTKATKMDGIVEDDETFIGGKTSNKDENKINRNENGRAVAVKTPVCGI